MANSVTSLSLEAAIEDFQTRTLAGMSGEIAQLVYLASTRDYNTGEYYHDGLAARFSQESARAALAAHHKKVFQALVSSSLERLVEDLKAYIRSACVSEADFFRLWKKLEPYRVTIPLDCDGLSAQLFFSNIRIALAVLQARRETDQNGSLAALPQPSPGQSSPHRQAG